MSREKQGILFCSYGDIERKEQLKNYYKDSLKEIVLSRLSYPYIDEILAEIAWQNRKKDLEKEYEKIQFQTNYLQNSLLLAEKVQEKLREKDIVVSVYVGFNFLREYSINQALEKAKKDGVQELFVISHGAAYSPETTGISFRQIKGYFDFHNQGWDVKVKGIRSFIRNSKFIDLLCKNLVDNVNRLFPTTEQEDICLFLPVHGIGVHKNEHELEIKDPYLKQTRDSFDLIKTKLNQYQLEIGFQNHDYHQIDDIRNLINWTIPDAEKVAERIAHDAWNNVIIDGNLGFLIDNKETLVEHEELKEIIMKHNPKNNIKVEIAPILNSNDLLANFISDIVLDSMQGKGDLIQLK